LSEKTTNHRRFLETSVVSLRVFGLLRILEERPDSSLLPLLKEFEAIETNLECLALFGHAIALHSGEALKEMIPASSDFPSLTQIFSTGTPCQRRQALQRLSRKQCQVEAEVAMDLLKKEQDPLVGHMLLKRFGPFIPEKDLPALLCFLSQTFISLSHGAAEILAQRCPRQLIQNGVSLLISTDPFLRGLAVRALQKFDPLEALAHLDGMLFNPDPSVRRSGLHTCVLFPLEQVRATLLRYLAWEKDASLLEDAGIILITNPDREIPFRVWEIAEHSSPEKRKLLKFLVESICKTIRNSGILSEEYGDFVKRLQEWVQERSVSRFVQESLNRFTQLEQEDRPSFLEFLSQRLQIPAVRQGFEQARQWPLSEAALQALERILGGGSGNLAGQPPGPAIPETDPTTNLSADERLIRRLALLGNSAQEEGRVEIERILRDGTGSGKVRAAALRAAGRLRIPGFVEDSRKLLSQKDPGLATAALQYLDAFDPDQVIIQLGKFINSPVPRVKVTALKILQHRDPTQAVSTLVAMLESKNPAMQIGAVNCLLHFDFSLVRNRLYRFLLTCTDKEFFKSGLCLFEANPDLENEYSLFCLEKKVAGFHELISETRRRCRKQLQNTGCLAPGGEAAFQAALEQRFAAEEERKKAPPPAYAFQKLVAQPALPASGETAAWGKSLGAVAALFVLALGGQWYFSLEEPAKPSSHTVAVRATSREEVCTVLAYQWDNGEFQVSSESGKKYLLSFSDFPEDKPKLGDLLRIELFPHLQNPDGTIVARAGRREKLSGRR
jgi:HEAT repeat protein